MNAIVEALLGNAVLVAVLAPLVFVVGRRLDRRPAIAHALWVLVLLKLVTPPLVGIDAPVRWFAAPRAELGAARPIDVDAIVRDVTAAALGAREAADPADPAAAPPLPPAASWWSPVRACLVAWFGVAAAILLRAAWRFARLVRLIRQGAVPDDGMSGHVRRLAATLGLTRRPRVIRVDAPISPMILGWGPRSALVLPGDLEASVGTPAFETILVHELAHYRRGDHWVRGLELAVGALFWWHPVVWWARREMHRAEEACCDAWVVRLLPERRREYATALVECAGLLRGAPHAVPCGSSAVGSKKVLKRRVVTIMSRNIQSDLGRAGRRFLAGAALLVLPFAFGLARGTDDTKSAPPPPEDPLVTIESVIDELRAANAGPKVEEQIRRLDELRARVSEERWKRQMFGVNADRLLGGISGAYDGPANVDPTAAPPSDAKPKKKAPPIPAVLLELVDGPDPARVGDEITYTVKVSNLGNIDLTNLRVACELPSILGLVRYESPTGIQQNGATILFGPLAVLPVGATETWKVIALAAGGGRITFTSELTADHLPRPVKETEETTIAAADR